MFDLSNPNTFWLNTISFVLALVIVASGLGVVRVAYSNARVRFRNRIHVAGHDHSIMVPDLGITMADGGARIDGRSTARADRSFVAQDEENIFRSEN